MSLSDVSKYFNENSLDEIIRKVGGVRHTSYEFAKTSEKKGDSYLSVVRRLKVCGVDVNDKPLAINVIIKSIPDNVSRRKLFRSADFFRNEIHFYENVLPAFEEFQRSKNPKNPFTEYPRCLLSHCDGENDFIALENINFLGYISPDRQSCITLTDCLLIIKTLGRFHGLSVAFRDQEPDNFDKAANCLEEVYYSERLRPWYTKFLDDAMLVARDAVSKTFPNSKYEELTNKYLSEGLYSDQIDLVSKKSRFSVVGHGDCWSPNFMTKFDGETALAIKIIDFQLARYASFALDFMFFIYSCTSQELREKHFEEIFEAYHASAADIVKDLGSDPEKMFPIKEVRQELTEFGRFGCGMGIESLPMSMMEDEDVADLDALTIADPVLTDVWKIYPFKEEFKRRRIAECLKHGIDSGFIV
ncbi:hypothetical protein ACFFRR_008232 [Megaselia abdita]